MMGGSSRLVTTLKEKKSKPYSFRKDRVAKIFSDSLKNELQLPECKRPVDMEKYDDPNYCPYHRILGYTIKDCWVFKDWVERKNTEREKSLYGEASCMIQRPMSSPIMSSAMKRR
jgi:hypothetical protein